MRDAPLDGRLLVRPISSGAGLSRELTARTEHTAAALGNVGIDVVATTVLILYIEDVCNELLEPHYEAGEATVGARVEVDHLAPAQITVPLEVSVELIETKGRRLIFSAEVRQEGKLVMKGFHHRAVVDIDRFANRKREHPEEG